MPSRYPPLSSFLVLATLLTACGQPAAPATDGDIYRLVVTIPARVPTIEAGELEAFLYADEPPLEDMHDDLLELDARVVRFTHRQGTTTRKTVVLAGEVPGGHNVGVHVLGYTRRDSTRKQVLWDGQDGTKLVPLTHVTLHLLPDEAPEADALKGSLSAWQGLKKANGGAYRYEVGFSSMSGEYGKTTSRSGTTGSSCAPSSGVTPRRRVKSSRAGRSGVTSWGHTKVTNPLGPSRSCAPSAGTTC